MLSRCNSCPARLPLDLPPPRGVPQCCEACERLVPLYNAGPIGDRELLCRRCAVAGDWLGSAVPRLCGACGRHVALYWHPETVGPRTYLDDTRASIP